MTGRIKESSESRGRRPFQDDDAFLSGNMAGSSGKRKSKSHPCVVRMPVDCYPVRLLPSDGLSGHLRCAFMPAIRKRSSASSDVKSGDERREVGEESPGPFSVGVAVKN